MVVVLGLYELALRSAAGRVRHGWTQGAYHRQKDGRRLVDLCYALELAAEEFCIPVAELRRLVSRELDRRYREEVDPWGLEHWNDEVLREKGDVIIVLERTAGRLGRAA